MNGPATPSKFRKAINQLRRRAKDGSFAHRLIATLAVHAPWYDWGSRVMVLTGRYRTGTYEPPRGRNLWYHQTSRGRFVTTRDYADVRAAPDLEWKTFDVQDEGGSLMLGYYGDRITFYGLDRAELKLFRHWDFWECRARGEWFGLRRWLYYKALHHHVNLKKPFACNVTPPPFSGGYNHWHCELRGKHTTHRFRNYTWDRANPRVEYTPVPVDQPHSTR